MNKLFFIQNEFPKLVSILNGDEKGKWGVLNALQMVEHMADSVNMATGKNKQKLHTPPEHVQAYKNFAMSDKEFKPNTKNALMSETPIPSKTNSVKEAIKEYNESVANFISYFENKKETTLTNPFFGELNFDEWIHLLHKHAVHHCKQFGLLD